MERKEIFISYSNEDINFVKRLQEAFENSNLFNVKIDYTDINPGDDIEERIIKLIEESDIFLLCISNNALKSDWVKKEFDLAFKRDKDNDNFVFIPILIEDIKNNNDYIMNKIKKKRIHIGDFRVPDAFEREFKKLSETLCSIFNIKDCNIDNTIIKLGLQVNSELERYKKIIDEVVGKRLKKNLEKIEREIDNIKQLSLIKNKILTMDEIITMEREVEFEVWIVTTHFLSDTEDEELIKVIDTNISKGVKYTYFHPDNDIMKKRIEIFGKRHKNKEGIDFIPLDQNMLYPFDEIAIYEPNEDKKAKGYIQLSYYDGVFIDIDRGNLCSMVRTLKKIKEKRK